MPPLPASQSSVAAHDGKKPCRLKRPIPQNLSIFDTLSFFISLITCVTNFLIPYTPLIQSIAPYGMYPLAINVRTASQNPKYLPV